MHDDFNNGGDHEPDDDLLAGEYVLGVLDAQGRKRVQGRIESEPGFAALVSAWEQRLGAWLGEIESVQAPSHVWPRVRTSLGWLSVQGARRGLWEDINVWRGATAAAIAAAAALAVVFLVNAPTPTPAPMPDPIATTPAPAPVATPSPVTTLQADDGSPAYLASVDAQRGRVTVMPVPSAPDAQGRVPELWLIAEGEPARSLGVIDTAVAHEIQVPQELLAGLVPGSLLAVTLEPPGGAPQGVATGPITAKGAIERI
ncbi:MAG: anti-sigma factor [Pseudomonadota bacterium]|nr:anti-sigma factor [Pseudomonadota bacterium]